MKAMNITRILDQLRWAASELKESVAPDSPNDDQIEVAEILVELQSVANRVMKFCAREEVTL